MTGARSSRRRWASRRNGATRGTILWQFLIETVTLTATGAMVGLLLGWRVAVRHTTPIAASVPNGAVLAALVASAIAGIVFGMLPALAALRLDPADALRYTWGDLTGIGDDG